MPPGTLSKNARGTPMVCLYLVSGIWYLVFGILYLGKSTEVESSGSFPAIVWKRISASETVLAKGPIWSNDDAMATRPEREMAPYVGFMPTSPQKLAGWRTEPAVSEPKAPNALPMASAAAEPPEEPPGTRVSSYGFLVTPYAECSVEAPIANSSILVLPRKSAPASSNFLIAVALYVARYRSSILDAHDAILPSIRILSFIASGIPKSAESFSPFFNFLSASFAFSKQSSNTSKYALMVGFFSATTARHSSASSTDEKSPRERCSRAFSMVRVFISMVGMH